MRLVNYDDVVRDWARSDAKEVLDGQHAHGYKGLIRLRQIKSMKDLTELQKRGLYHNYCEMLLGLIFNHPTLKIRGTNMPSFSTS